MNQMERRYSQRVLPALVLVWNGCADLSMTEEGTSHGEGAAQTTTGDLGGTAGSSGTSGAAGATPFEQAALLACAARQTTPPTSLPYDATDPYAGTGTVTGFYLGNDFPQRFTVDVNSEDFFVHEGDIICHEILRPEELKDGKSWWFSGGQWLEPDGDVHVYLATNGVDEVIYYGSDESGPTFEPPGAPRTDAVEFDSTMLCPELPRVWIPDPSGAPDNAGLICMHHTEPVAEVVFVYVP